MAASAAVLVGVIVLPEDVTHTEELQVRGEQTRTPVHLRLLCISNDGRPGVDIVEAGSSCPAGSFAKILLGAGASTKGRFAILVVENGRVTSLYPDEFSLPLSKLPGKPTPLSGSKRVVTNASGIIRFVALVTDEMKIDEQDALVTWARSAKPGVFADIQGRADAVVTDIRVDRGTP